MLVFIIIFQFKLHFLDKNLTRRVREEWYDTKRTTLQSTLAMGSIMLRACFSRSMIVVLDTNGGCPRVWTRLWSKHLVDETMEVISIFTQANFAHEADGRLNAKNF
jgi:hypothetical protein